MDFVQFMNRTDDIMRNFIRPFSPTQMGFNDNGGHHQRSRRLGLPVWLHSHSLRSLCHLLNKVTDCHITVYSKSYNAHEAALCVKCAF